MLEVVISKEEQAKYDEKNLCRIMGIENGKEQM